MMIFMHLLRMVKYLAHQGSESDPQKIITDANGAGKMCFWRKKSGHSPEGEWRVKLAKQPLCLPQSRNT